MEIEECVRTLTASQIRSRLERVHAEMLGLEKEMQRVYDNQKGGINVPLVEMRHEVTEATEGIERAIECIDANYRALL